MCYQTPDFTDKKINGSPNYNWRQKDHWELKFCSKQQYKFIEKLIFVN